MLGIVEDMSGTLTRASALLVDALSAIDAEMGKLQQRLADDAQHLREALDEVEVSEEGRGRLQRSLARVEETAAAVARFTRRTADTIEPASHDRPYPPI